MKFFKTLKRKAGNALLPVLGTILGLTILAGSVVGVALQSSKIVYRDKKLQNQNDARQILYIAAKYFCTEINNGKTPAEIRAELQEIFGPGLKITQDTVDPEKYYIWYPNSFVNGSQTEYDPSQDENQVKEWLKATITKSEQADDDGDYGDSGINNTLFSETAKLDEKFAVGNMMTVYLTDEHLLPGRRYSINEISLVESDIDTFDEAFTYMNNTGVLEIDDIGVALYRYGQVQAGDQVSYVDTPESASEPYTIVYKTGNLGGNYYWSDGSTSKTTWLYRQEYDIDMLYDMMLYYDSSFSVSKSDLKYRYDDATDSHTLYATDFTLVYSSTQRFAEAIADYVFWQNLPRLCMNVDEFKTKIEALVKNQVDNRVAYKDYWGRNVLNKDDYYYQASNSPWKYTYEWKNEGLTVYPYYRNSEGNWYSEYDYTTTEIENIFCNNLTGYKGSDGKLDYNKLYEKLTNKYTSIAKADSNFVDILERATTYYDPTHTNNNNKLDELHNGGVISYTDTTLQTTEMYKSYAVKGENDNTGDNYTLTNFVYQNNDGTYVKKKFGGKNDKDGWVYFYNKHQYSDEFDFSYFYKEDRSSKVSVWDNKGREKQYYPNYFNPNFYEKSNYGSFDYTLSTGNNTLTRQIIDYLNEQFMKKYVDGNSKLNSSEIQSGYSFDSFAGDEENGKMICQPQWYKKDGKMHILFHYNVIVKYAENTFVRKVSSTDTCFVEKYRYEIKNWCSENSGDSIDMTYTEFFEKFADGIAEIYADKHMTEQEISQITHQDSIETLTRNYLKNLMVDPIRYQYLPTSNFSEIVGYNTTGKPGMKQLAITNKLVKYYLENAEDELKASIGNADYEINIKNSYYNDNLSGTYKDYLNYIVEFEIKLDKDNNGTFEQTENRKISFIIQYVTYSAQNNALYDSSTNTYTDSFNRNVTSALDTDGQYKNFFSPVVIKDSEGKATSVTKLQSGEVKAVLSNVPYTERINSTQVPYGDHKITIDGRDYKVATSLAELTNVTENTLYPTSIENLGSSSFTINVAAGVSLFINGDLHLMDSQKLNLGRNALLFVNGNMQIEYRQTILMDKTSSGAWHARQLTPSNINSFRSYGVDVTAGADAKLMINGDLDYRGFKAKYATSSSGWFRINNVDGTYEDVQLDVIYEQYVLNSNNNNISESIRCKTNQDGTHTHYQNECRGKLEGIYIVNGDVRFHAWDEKNTTNNSYSNTVAMYRNMYSNPIINGTFYVDGSFDMKGLFTSGLYDPCRANFVFAKSIVEPLVALNTILCAGKDTQYGAWADSDGYLFMICEEAIDFSKVNFACVNLFTPFQELVNAINANKQSATNFSEFIEKSVFTAMYPNKDVIDEWGLPSILRSGLKELYAPGDIGAITPEDHIYGNEV